LTWHSCSLKSGDVELSIKLLIEMLGHGNSHKFCVGFVLNCLWLESTEGDEAAQLEKDLVEIFEVICILTY
jgi:hypothetical protein